MEVKNKGGRIPNLAADYYTMRGVRSPQLKYLKMKFGSEGIDFYVSCSEQLCQSNHFLWHFDCKYQLEVFLTEKIFDQDRFKEILKFSVVELGLFDLPLYENGYLFSTEFVARFDQAGLFTQRTVKAKQILEYVNAKRGAAIPLTMDDSSVEGELRKQRLQDDKELPF